MKAAIPLTLSAFVLALLVAPSPSLIAAEPEFYPWSETAPMIRVPKKVLGQVPLTAVSLTLTEPRRFALTEQIIRTLRLTSTEVEQVTRALAESLHEYSLEETRHSEPIDAASIPLPAEIRARLLGGPGGIEQVHFQWNPFPEEAAAIRRTLKTHLVAILGEERGNIFWSQAESVIIKRMPGAKALFHTGLQHITVHTYALSRGLAGLFVFRKENVLTFGAEGQLLGGGGNGESVGPDADIYAPAALKPMLEKWRLAMAAEVGVVFPPRPGTPELPRVRIQSTEEERWDDGLPYIELPRSLATMMRVPALTPQGEISPVATGLYGLTSDERKGILELYHDLKARSEKLQKAHLEQPDRFKAYFVIRPFPEEILPLQQEWQRRLKELVGTIRADLVDRAIRASAGPDWLERGMRLFRLNVTWLKNLDGSLGLRFEYQDATSAGTESGRIGDVPERWRHLFTPEMLVPLDPPVAL